MINKSEQEEVTASNPLQQSEESESWGVSAEK